MIRSWTIWMCLAALGCPARVPTGTDTDVADTDPGVDPCTGVAGEVRWSWPDVADWGRFAASNPAAGRISVVTSDPGGSILVQLDAATGQFLSARTLLDADAPSRPFLSEDLVDVTTAIFVARDEAGRTFVLDVPNSGDETSIPTLVHRFEPDGTKTFETALQGAVHGSLQIEPDGLGGVVVAVVRMPAEQRTFVRIAPDGTVAWELDPEAAETLYGFAIVGESVRMARSVGTTPSILDADLRTGERGASVDIVAPPLQLEPHRVAPAPGGDLYLLATQNPGNTSVLRVDPGGAILWQTATGTHGYRGEPWTLDLASLGSGEGVCAGTPIASGTDDRNQRLVCLDADGAVVGDLGTVSNAEGGIHLDSAGGLFTTDRVPHLALVGFCPPF